MNHDHWFEKGVVRLLLEEGENADFQTAWFFTHNGALITAGHGFEDIEAELQTIFTVEHPRSNWQGKAILEEYGSGKDGTPDYALLRIKGEMPSGLIHIPFSASAFRERLAFPLRVSGFGYNKDLERTHNFEGTIRNTSGRYQGKGTQLLQVDTGNYEALGLSGGPLVIDSPNKQSGALGLQIEQGAEQRTKQIFYAESLHTIVTHSKKLKALALQEFNLDVVRRWPLSLFEKKHHSVFQLSFDGRKRLIAILRPLERGLFGHDVAEKLSGTTHIFKERLTKSIDQQHWLHNGNGKQALDVFFESYAWEHDDAEPPTLAHFFSDAQTNIPPADWPFIRVILDLTGELDLRTIAGFNRPEHLSHLVVVRLKAPKTEWVVGPNGLADLILDVSCDNSAEASSIILNTIQDLLLDANIFHGIAFLRNNYLGRIGRQSFSKVKAKYILERALSPAGLPVPKGDVKYLSLSSCARPTLMGETNNSRLHEIWLDFINKFLWPALLDRIDGMAEPLTDAVAIEYFCRSAKIGGQLSRRRLAQRLAKLMSQDGELVALAKVIASPRDRETRMALQHLFRPGKKLRKLVGAFSVAELPQLCNFHPYVKIFLYSRRVAL